MPNSEYRRFMVPTTHAMTGPTCSPTRIEMVPNSGRVTHTGSLLATCGRRQEAEEEAGRGGGGRGDEREVIARAKQLEEVGD